MDRCLGRNYWTEAMNWLALDQRNSDVEWRSTSTRKRRWTISSNKLRTQCLITHIETCGWVTVRRATVTGEGWIRKVTHTWLNHIQIRSLRLSKSRSRAETERRRRRRTFCFDSSGKKGVVNRRGLVWKSSLSLSLSLFRLPFSSFELTMSNVGLTDQKKTKNNNCPVYN